MAKRLYMTTADYVTIALSPALIMTLVGSLVYFLIEVLYVGDYQARLMYVFALFVFAAVLVARIAIEMGSAYASMFALPLGAATFLVLLRFVEHPSPLSPLINLALLAVVWWCAHRLTWDCTLIDDEEDASGEGLMQRIGVGAADNELLASPAGAATEPAPWWRRWAEPKRKTHAPGVWVLYFSLAALPLFGLGQQWIPPAEIGRRRYAFALLLVYVASALALLVTTSFLGLRRYLRQRRVEMPAPMAATWVAIGVVVILLVMFVAALVPRPHAEYAISQVPWQARSPDGLSSSRYGTGSDAADEHQTTGPAESDEGPPGDSTSQDAQGEPAASDNGKSTTDQQGERGEKATDQAGEGTDNQSRERAENQSDGDSRSNDGQASGDAARAPLPEHPPSDPPLRLPRALPLPLGGLAGLLKLMFYVVLAILIAVFVWRNRKQLAAALADILRQLRELIARLFGGGRAAAEAISEEASPTHRRERSFREFSDPFLTGDARRLPPEELVRYTFEAFEAWARDGGYPRSPDQTPWELVHAAVAPRTGLFGAARRMVRLYGEVAYASGNVSTKAAQSLREFWELMRTTEPNAVEPAPPA